MIFAFIPTKRCDPEMSEDFLINRRYATELFTRAVPLALKGRARKARIGSPLRGVCIGTCHAALEHVGLGR